MPSIFRFKDHIINIDPEDILMVTPTEELDSVEVEKSTWFKSSVIHDFDIYKVFVDTAYSEYVFEFSTEDERSEFISELYQYLNVDSTVTSTFPNNENITFTNFESTTTKKSGASKTKATKTVK